MAMVGIDTGGTFTDFVAMSDDGSGVVSFKVPSVPEDPARAVERGLERLERQHGIAPAAIRRLTFGTTVATNAVLEAKGARTALVATRGTRDVIEIQRLWRARLFDLHIQRPAPLVPRRWRFEVDERMAADSSVVEALSDDEAERIARLVAEGGFDAVAVCCLFSFLHPEHEQCLRDAIAARAPAAMVSLSSDVSPQFREYERATTTVMNAYVMPAIDRLVARLEALLEARGCGAPLRIIQSNGGLMTPATARRLPVHTLLSGPAGGVVGALEVARAAGFDDIITMDMGGTSLDICLVEDARVVLTSEGRIGPYPVQVPQVNVHTIGAGGGSIARCLRGALKVGPASAGAVPGPACYGRGGLEPTSTDAALLLGYIDAENFLGGEMRLDVEAARTAMREHVARPLSMSVEEAAEAVIAVQVANMVTGIRAVSVERGLDARDFALMPFGGAGALYAARVAETLGMRTIVVPIQPSVLSALGMLLTDIKHTAVSTRLMDADAAQSESLRAIFTGLRERLTALLADDGVSAEDAHFAGVCEMRYRGQAYEVAVEVSDATMEQPDPAALVAAFHAAHHALYGQSAQGETVEIVNFRVIARGRLTRPRLDANAGRASHAPTAETTRRAFHPGTGWSDTPAIARERLAPGMRVAGPLLIDEPGASVVLHPGQQLEVDAIGNLIVHLPVSHSTDPAR